MAGSNSQRIPRGRGGWRRLGAFWLSVLSLMAIGGGVVQWMGPPDPTARPRQASAAPPAVAVVSAPRIVDDRVALLPPPGVAGPGKTGPGTVAPVLAAPVGAGRDTPGPIADPDPALLEPSADGSRQTLPRISSDGRTAMQVYAAGFDHSSRRPRVGVLLAGIGLNEAESDAAIRNLPGAISLAVSPYSANTTRMLATARATGHEYLVALPLEPAGFPLNDPGPSTLLTSASPAANLLNLRWTLSRIQGYVGTTGVIGTMRGERLAAMTDQMDAVLTELSDRGLLYVDPREDRGPVTKAWGRHVQVVIDDPSDQQVADRAMIDAKLAELEQMARDTGSALGLVMRPTPVAVARLAAWCNGLSARGLALAPVSALAMPPADAAVKFSERDH